MELFTEQKAPEVLIPVLSVHWLHWCFYATRCCNTRLFFFFLWLKNTNFFFFFLFCLKPRNLNVVCVSFKRLYLSSTLLLGLFKKCLDFLTLQRIDHSQTFNKFEYYWMGCCKYRICSSFLLRCWYHRNTLSFCCSSMDFFLGLFVCLFCFQSVLIY